jgi:hypothetical protein
VAAMKADDPLEDALRARDVYVYYTGTSELIETLDPSPAKFPELRFLADIGPGLDGGDWTAMAIMEVESLYDLSSAADRLLAGPEDPVTDAEKPVLYGTAVLRKTKHFPFFGFARLKVNVGEARRVLEEIDAARGYSGSALVSGGKFNALVELGGETPEEVGHRLADLGGVPGVSGSSSGIVAGDEYYYGRTPAEAKRRRIGQSEETT